MFYDAPIIFIYDSERILTLDISTKKMYLAPSIAYCQLESKFEMKIINIAPSIAYRQLDYKYA